MEFIHSQKILLFFTGSSLENFRSINVYKEGCIYSID